MHLGLLAAQCQTVLLQQCEQLGWLCHHHKCWWVLLPVWSSVPHLQAQLVQPPLSAVTPHPPCCQHAHTASHSGSRQLMAVAGSHLLLQM